MPDRIITFNGHQYLVRDGEVFRRLIKWWSSKPEHVSADNRATVLDMAEQASS